jgi:hypothetical protein
MRLPNRQIRKEKLAAKGHEKGHERKQISREQHALTRINFYFLSFVTFVLFVA